MATDAGVEHSGSMLASVPYIWIEPRHVLKGLTPTCVNKNLEKFLSPPRPPRASAAAAYMSFAQLQQVMKRTCSNSLRLVNLKPSPSNLFSTLFIF